MAREAQDQYQDSPDIGKPCLFEGRPGIIYRAFTLEESSRVHVGYDCSLDRLVILYRWRDGRIMGLTVDPDDRDFIILDPNSKRGRQVFHEIIAASSNLLTELYEERAKNLEPA